MQSKFINAGSKRNRYVILEEILEERKNKAAKTEEYRNEKLCLMELIETLKKALKVRATSNMYLFYFISICSYFFIKIFIQAVYKAYFYVTNFFCFST